VLNRCWLGIDINPEFIEMSQRRIEAAFEGFNSIDPRLQRTPKDLPKIAQSQQPLFTID
jgi:hypothetical protein